PAHSHAAGRGQRSAGTGAERTAVDRLNPEQSPVIRDSVVQLRCNRARYLWACAAQAAQRRTGEDMSAELQRLANGLTIAVDPMPGAQSVSIGLYAQVGSRSEPAHVSGLAHVVEHMVFKGAGKRDTRALAEAIEDVGGAMNAWTARDQTVFYGRTLAKDAPLLCELLADLIRAPHLADDHLQREKDVILSELGEVTDAPDDLVHEHLFEAAFDGQPLGRSVLGRPETIRAITRDDCLAWIEGELVPSRLILSASGKIDPDELL